jgi:hypothetical protein
MLEFLRGKATDRKLRLFAVACCRRIRDLLQDERSRKAVDVAERYADREATEHERFSAARAAADAYVPLGAAAEVFYGIGVDDWPNALEALEHPAEVERCRETYLAARRVAQGQGVLQLHDTVPAACAACACYVAITTGNLCAEANRLAANAMRAVTEPFSYSEGDFEQSADFIELGKQAQMLHDIIGNPFRPAAVDSGWLTPGVVEMARTIYDSRAFDRMPELADALEDAGCHDAVILNHCRQPGGHVRGCWVVDAILGKT